MASLWCLLICVIVAFGATFGFSVLILWLIFITHKIKFYVTDATLTQFNFTNNNNNSEILHYNLGVYFTIRNPNEHVGIYYDTIEATAMYKDRNFDTRLLTPFYQSPKATSLVKARFNGQQQQLVPIASEEKVSSEFNSEKVAGIYGIDVKFRLWIRVKFGIFMVVRVRPKVGCGFKAQLSFNGSSVPSFQTTGCRVDY